MFQFKLERDLSLLTVVRSGTWTLDTVRAYEAALRRELAGLRLCVRPTYSIVDIRSCDAPSQQVVDALRAMVIRLGPLVAERVAVVTASGLAKLEAKRVGDGSAEVFTSMVLARDWVKSKSDPAETVRPVYDLPSEVEVDGPVVKVRGPAGIDIALTPAAALETAKRIGDSAVEALLASPGTQPTMASSERRWGEVNRSLVRTPHRGHPTAS